MRALSSSQVYVADGVLLDGRLALFHEHARWLAVADLHFGFELSQRAAGNLFPLWGMQTVETRLEDLLSDFAPAHLVLLGDLVHDAAGANALFSFIARLKKRWDIVLIAGNHDRYIKHRTSNIKHLDVDLAQSWQCDGFYFHHGDCVTAKSDCIQIIGHHHPAAVMRDGAGLRLKLPAFVQQPNCWIMPAFSPWAAGTVWPGGDESCVWLCSPQRVLRIAQPGIAV